MLSDLVLYVLHQYQDSTNPLRRDLTENPTLIPSALSYDRYAGQKISDWAHTLKLSHYLSAIHDLAREDNGWHFGATYTNPDQVREFQLEDMAAKMYEQAPELCEVVECLLGSDRRPTADEGHVPGEVVSDSDDDLWEALGDPPVHAKQPGAQPRSTKRKGKKVLRAVFRRIVNIFLCTT